MFDADHAEHQQKLDAVEQLDELARATGCTLPQLAVAFTQTHPAVTSTILGPRTLDQLTTLLDTSDLVLDDAVLNRIDETTPPGTGLFPEWSWRPPALTDPGLRRRRPENHQADHRTRP